MKFSKIWQMLKSVIQQMKGFIMLIEPVVLSQTPFMLNKEFNTVAINVAFTSWVWKWI